MPPPEFTVGTISGYAAGQIGLGPNKKMMIPPANESPELTALERSVLETAFSSKEFDSSLREQIDVATVAVRTPSGVGFITKLSIPEEYHVVDAAADNAVPVVIGDHPTLPSGAEFILQVKDGRINCIEAFCHEGMWPVDETQFQVHLGQGYAGH